MPFDLIHPNKTRSRSVQLDKACATAAVTPTSPPPAIATRSSSLAYRENRRPVFRSMLDVEPAPRIGPLKVLDLDELHRDVMPLSECQAPWFRPHCSLTLTRELVLLHVLRETWDRIKTNFIGVLQLPTAPLFLPLLSLPLASPPLLLRTRLLLSKSSLLTSPLLQPLLASLRTRTLFVES